MLEKTVVYFSFSIPNRRGGAPGGLADFFSKMTKAKITLQGISGFASGQRMRILCLPNDADKFRAFLKERGLRARELKGIDITAQKQLVVNLVHRWALSGKQLRAFNISSKAGGLVYFP